MSLTKVTYAMIDGISINVQDFGADSSGVADSSSAIQSAVNTLSATGGTLYYPQGTYRQVNVSIPSNVSVQLNSGAKIIQAANTGDVFKSEGTLGSAVLLTVDALVNATTLTVTSGATFAAGDWLILSDTVDYSVSPAAVGYKSGESVIVKSVVGDVITLNTPIYGSQQATESYTVANGSSVRKVTPVKNVSFSGGEIELLYSSNTNGIYTRYVDGVNVSNMEIHNFAGSGVFPKDSRNVTVQNCIIYDGRDEVVSGFPGYGVCVGGACDVVNVSNNKITAVRHAFTTIGGSTGFPIRCLIANNQTYATKFIPLDTHEAGKDITFRGNAVQGTEGSLASGINLRTGYTIVQDNEIDNVASSGIGVVGTNLKNINITGNKIRNTGSYGIIVGAAYPNVSVTNNDLLNIGDHGIQVSPDENLVVSNNTINNVGLVTLSRRGIYVFGSNTDPLVISNNVINSNSGSAIYAIEIPSTAVGVVNNNSASGAYSTNAYELQNIGNFTNYVIENPRYVIFTLEDDTVYTFDCEAGVQLLMSIGSASSGNGFPNGIFRARPNGSPQCAAVTTFASNITFTTGVLTGTTGIDGNCTISATDGAIYVENRTGGQSTMWIQITGPLN